MLGKIYFSFGLFAFLLAIILLLYSNNLPWCSTAVSSKTLFMSFGREIKALDPSTSYYVHESAILDNIVDSPLDYDYTARPYKLITKLLEEIPQAVYYGHNQEIISADSDNDAISRVEYHLKLKEDIKYQPHPCFAKKEDGTAFYLDEDFPLLKDKLKSIQDFPEKDSRTISTEDIRTAILRLSDPRMASPVYSNLSSFILGMQEASEAIKEEIERLEIQKAESAEKANAFTRTYPVLVDYRKIDFAGFEIINEREAKLVLSRKYPQVLYWLAMHFFAPLPWEALQFYHQKQVIDSGFEGKNWPVGSGAYMLTKMHSHNEIELIKNPNYREEYFAGNKTALPYIDKVLFQYEREAIPNWIKFNQGYYDSSGIPTDFFDAATSFNNNGELALSEEMLQRDIQMHSSVTATIFYFGFNMLDETVGGNSEEKKALRQAISIVLDYQEFIDIFLNGQGETAQSVIPPGINGAQKSNQYVSPWNDELNKTQRLSTEKAKELMRKAGFPNGISAEGKPLSLFLDHANAGSVAFKAQFQWLKNKFSLLGIQLEERPSDLNRWRDKVQTGNWQLMFNKGWLADYPDPENFLFLFYSENGTVASAGRGANYVNYSSKEFDELFRKLESMQDGEERLKLIDKACKILQKDAPCCWGYHPAKVILTHSWLKNFHLHDISYGTLKYLDLDVEERLNKQRLWNRPRHLPVYLLAFLGLYFLYQSRRIRKFNRSSV